MRDTEADTLAPPAAVECALLTLSDQRLPLLIPWSAIAEVLESLPELLPADPAPGWLLGWLSWRELAIPVLDPGGIGEHRAAAPDPGRRLVVLKAIGPAAELAFYGLAIRDLPRPLRLGADSDLRAQPVTPPGGAAMLVEIGGEPALIPDFELLETLVRQAQAQAPVAG